jgi:hypothetical protein
MAYSRQSRYHAATRMPPFPLPLISTYRARPTGAQVVADKAKAA